MHIYLTFCCKSCEFSVSGDIAVRMGSAARAKQNGYVCFCR